MSGTVITIIVVAVIVVVILAVAGTFLGSRRQSQRQEEAREEYGPEYERAVEEQGSERKAEKDLRQRREQVESDVQPLSDESRSRYAERWDEVERTFVDDPVASLQEADQVVRDILEERNFPTDSRDEAARGVGVMHSDVVEDYREAQRTHQAAAKEEAGGSTSSDVGREEGREQEEGGADSERMRQAIQKYRSVYERLTVGD